MRFAQTSVRRMVRRTLLGLAAAGLLAAPGQAESNDSAVGDSDLKITFQAGHGNVEGDNARGATWYFEGA